MLPFLRSSEHQNFHVPQHRLLMVDKTFIMQGCRARVNMLSWLVTVLSSITWIALFTHLQTESIQVTGDIVIAGNFLSFYHFFFLLLIIFSPVPQPGRCYCSSVCAASSHSSVCCPPFGFLLALKREISSPRLFLARPSSVA